MPSKTIIFIDLLPNHIIIIYSLIELACGKHLITLKWSMSWIAMMPWTCRSWLVQTSASHSPSSTAGVWPSSPSVSSWTLTALLSRMSMTYSHVRSFQPPPMSDGQTASTLVCSSTSHRWRLTPTCKSLRLRLAASTVEIKAFWTRTSVTGVLVSPHDACHSATTWQQMSLTLTHLLTSSKYILRRIWAIFVNWLMIWWRCRFKDTIKIVHFIGANKPWKYTYDLDGNSVHGQGPYESEHLSQWWSIFASQLLSTLPDQTVSLVSFTWVSPYLLE